MNEKHFVAISLGAKIPGKLTDFDIVGANSSQNKLFLPLFYKL